MITIEQLKDVKERTEALDRYLDIDRQEGTGGGRTASYAGSRILG